MENNLVKLALAAGGRIEPLMVPYELSKGTGQTNPSLFIEDGKLLVNLRGVQYAMLISENKQQFNSTYGPLAYINPENDVSLRTTNFFMKLNTNLEVERTDLVNTSLLDVKPVWEFIGLEDARHVKWEDKYFLIGVRRDTKPNGEGRMEFSEIEIRQHKVKEINRTRIEPPGKPTYCEKNWMPVLDMPYHFVKWSNPTEIVKVNLKEKSSETIFMGEPFPAKRDIRGGSPVITYGDYRFAITHEVDLWKNALNQKDSQYYHRIVIWDKNWNIVKVSDEFKFMDGAIEFSIGLAVHEDEAYIAFGFHDNAAYILKVPVQFLFNFAFNFDFAWGELIRNNTTNNTLIEQFISEPRNLEINFNLANWYFEQKHYAGAISHYLRCAEFSDGIKNTLEFQLSYESLIQISNCFKELGNRQICEKGYLNLALSFDPSRPEAYWLLSLYHERRKEWQECYTAACIGLQHTYMMAEQKYDQRYPQSQMKSNGKHCPNGEKGVPGMPGYMFPKGFGYAGDYVLYFQKAFAAWWIGRYSEAREMFFSMPDDFKLNEQYTQLVQNNMNILGIGEYPFLPYTGEMWDALRYKFNESRSIQKNYSQVMQDMFVLTALDGKRNGFYLEIGAADPIKGSNTYLLEKDFDWKGISIEINEAEVAKWKGVRNNRILCIDAAVINYNLLLKEAPKDIDYLQVDCEPPAVTYDILTQIPFDTHRFAVITFEHDYYADASRKYRALSRELLNSLGYILVASDISADGKNSFEDWWIHPELVQKDLIEINKLSCVSRATRADKLLLSF